MKTILYTTSFADIYGGGQAGLLLLLERLDRRRFRPVLMVPAEGAVARRAREIGCEVHIFPLPGWRSGPAVPGVLWKLRRFLREQKVSLVHTDAPRATFYAVLSRAGLGIPVVWHIRSPFRDRLLDWFLERRVDRIILVAKTLQSRFTRAAWGRTVVIYNGVDLGEPPAPETASLPEVRRPLLICPARLDRRHKAQHDLIAALGRLQASSPAPAVWCVGEIDAEYETSLKRQADGLGLSDIHFLGFRADLRSLLTLADAVVLPSLLEAFPRALLEAMAAGKPVVATAVGGVPELVVDGETGLLVPPGDPAALARALGALLADRSGMARMGNAGRRRVEAFSSQAMIGAIESIYDEELGRERP